jgi:hypothetical protein
MSRPMQPWSLDEHDDGVWSPLESQQGEPTWNCGLFGLFGVLCFVLFLFYGLENHHDKFVGACLLMNA